MDQSNCRTCGIGRIQTCERTARVQETCRAPACASAIDTPEAAMVAHYTYPGSEDGHLLSPAARSSE